MKAMKDISPIYLAGRDEDPISLATRDDINPVSLATNGGGSGCINGGGSSCIHGGGSGG